MLVCSVISFRLSRWQSCTSKAKSLDRMQRKMVGHILNFKFDPSKSVEANLRSKNKLINQHVHNKLWSRIWAKRVTSWDEHVSRNTLGYCWSAKLADVMTPKDLAYRRTQNNARLDTRSVASFVSLRWYESLQTASSLF